MSDLVPEIQTWHDESARYAETGRLDQGPCWCPDCLPRDNT